MIVDKVSLVILSPSYDSLSSLLGRNVVATFQPSNIVERVERVYQRFFADMNIDGGTGLLPCESKEFATFPYIGSRYGHTSARRLLVVGLDIGQDETPGRTQTLKERRAQIEDKKVSKHNPHIAGTYMMALYLLRAELPEWLEYWQRAEKGATSKELLKQENELPAENPLAYIALTNYHKFVTVNRRRRQGVQDRKFINRQLEGELLEREVEALHCDMVVFQGSQLFTPYSGTFSRISGPEVRITHVVPHPSAPGEGRRIESMVKNLHER